MKIPPGASPSPPPESCRAPSESPPAATANHGGSHQTAPSRPSPPSSGPSPPAAGATPTAPRAPPPQTPPPSPRTPPPSAASPPAATGPGHRPPGESWPCRLSWLLLLAAQSLLALQDAALDRPQSLELLAQRFFAFISVLIGALALARDALELAGEALALDDLRVKERRKASKPRCGGIGHRLEQFCCARVVAQRGGQRGEQRRKSQAIYGARLARKGVLRAGQGGLLLGRRRPRSAHGIGNDGLEHARALGARLEQRASAQGDGDRGDETPHAATGSARTGLRGKVTRKCPPLVSLTTLIRPPCASTNSRAMARPRPVPSMRPLAFARPRKNESKIDSRSSRGTPGPVSITSTMASRAAARVSTLMVPPLGVNFTALPSRLSMIERSFSGSASTLTLSRSSSRRCPLACTASWCGRATSWTRASSATARACSGPAECSARW